MPRFFIEFLTDPGDLVVGPFAGSNTTGAVAEKLKRRWISIEMLKEYAKDSELSFSELSNNLHGADAEPDITQFRHL